MDCKRITRKLCSRVVSGKGFQLAKKLTYPATRSTFQREMDMT
jgi:hypothetical protein